MNGILSRLFSVKATPEAGTATTANPAHDRRLTRRELERLFASELSMPIRR